MQTQTAAPTQQYIVNATVVFVINDTETITQPCKVNMDTIEVFDFDLNKVFNDNLRVLNMEYIILNGITEDIRGSESEFRTDWDFWYRE